MSTDRNLTHGVCWAIALCLALATEGRAEYILTPHVGGHTTATVERGQTFDVDLDLMSTTNDDNWGCCLRVLFSKEGLIYRGRNWGAPYSNSDDFLSEPSKMYFDHTVSGSTRFHEGTLLTLSFEVPEAFELGELTLSLRDAGFIGSSFPTNPWATTGTLTINVVPEPSTFVLSMLLAAAIGGVGLSRNGSRNRFQISATPPSVSPRVKV